MGQQTVILSLKYTAGDTDYEVKFNLSKHSWRSQSFAKQGVDNVIWKWVLGMSEGIIKHSDSNE